MGGKKRGVKGTWAVYREMLEREQSLLHFRAAMDDLETLDNDLDNDIRLINAHSKIRT